MGKSFQHCFVLYGSPGVLRELLDLAFRQARVTTASAEALLTARVAGSPENKARFVPGYRPDTACSVMLDLVRAVHSSADGADEVTACPIDAANTS